MALFVLCMTLRLLAIEHFVMFCPVVLLYLVDPVKHCDHLVGIEGTKYMYCNLLFFGFLYANRFFKFSVSREALGPRVM